MTEQEYKELIYDKASKVKIVDDLLDLIDEVTSYNHDYGTIVYGSSAVMRAAFNVINNCPQGGLTGAQASFLAHEMLQEFMMIKPPYRILEFDKILYPQYADRFEKTISPETWDYLQKKAKELLIQSDGAVSDNVKLHWQSVADGKIPFGFEIKDI